MCGICGEVSFQEQHEPAVATVEAMTERMHSRGPDASGLHRHDGRVFGHRRLSILDLSHRANQPMVDEALGLGIVYNGEVYNYRQIKRDLESVGYTFRTSGDTEVVLKAFHKWGPQFVQRTNGMFAFAIWQRETGRIVLGRDRLGIKPLYYSLDNGRLRFASSLPALLAADDIDKTIDPVALHHYMTFHSVVPPPYTMLKGVRKLPPGTLMTVEPDGSASTERYWSVDFNPRADEAKYTFEDWQDLVLEELGKAIDRRMVADVPVGVLLSGGLDSSLVVGMLAKHGQTGLNTFSIGFETVGEEKGDEFEYSDIIAEHFATQHHRIEVDTGRALPNLENAIRAMSEPMVSHDCIGFFLLSQEVARHVKVVQSGQGADEVFAGYHWYPPMLHSDEPVADYVRVFFDRDHAGMAEAIDPQLLGDDYSRAFVAEHFAMPGADRPIDKTLRLDTQVMLIDDPVKRVDNMTMAWGLEGRVPFLDHELVELSARIPAEMKVGPIDAKGQGVGKYVLKEAARRVIPSTVIDRPKGYFPVPALKYLQGEYLEMVRDVLNQPAARQRTLFNRDYVDKLLADPEQHITPLRGSKLWQVALLEYWLQVHGV